MEVGSSARRHSSSVFADGSASGGAGSGAVNPAAFALTPLKLVLAPMMAGTLESAVANRAEVQRYYGPQKLAAIETKLGWNAVARFCGPAFVANASRNFIMSATSFILTPTVFKECYPQEKKSQRSLFWFGLGMNVFVGNTVAITQQALWGRALDYAAVDGGRAINYRAVVNNGLSSEGMGAFYTPAKWFTRVLMNAPVQGTLPWFYNQVLPHGEPMALSLASAAYHSMGGSRGAARSRLDKGS